MSLLFGGDTNINLTLRSEESRALYNIAYKCAETRKQYKGRPCDVSCARCSYNIDKYGYHPKQVALIRGQAEAAFDNWHNGLLGPAIEPGICLGLIGMLIFIAVLFIIGTNLPGNTPISIEDAIQRTHTTIRDVNYDDTINCIDYAVRFHEVYPDAKIIQCKLASKDFNHLLNKVGDKYIEPQATDGSPYKMWPTQFMYSTKADVTIIWSMYARRKEW